MSNNKIFRNEQHDFHKSILFLRKSFKSFKNGLLENEMEKMVSSLDYEFIKWEENLMMDA